MRVLITGASSGFGWEMAQEFVRGGHEVVAVARRVEKLYSLKSKLGAALWPLEMDVQIQTSVIQGLASLPAEWQSIDVLINNAGLALGMAPAQQAKMEDWETMINTNCLGLVQVTHAILPQMVSRGSGLIINVGSIAGSYPYPGGNVYGATKAFVEQFTLNLRADLVGTGVRVTTIAPGLCGGTEFSLVRYKGDQVNADKVYQGTTPLSAEDIAKTVYWIANLPAHVNVNMIELMPVCQAFGPFAITREEPVRE